jgi:hypothetical protein
MAVLVVATARSLQRLAKFDVIPRTLADDTSVQWVGQDLRGARALWEAVLRYKCEVAEAGLELQVGKSGRVASSRRGQKAAKPFASMVKICPKQRMRNLGRDLNCTKARRAVAESRLEKLRPRMRRARTLRRAAGAKATCLWQTGLLLSTAHGAAVGGVSPSELGAMRSEAARLAGAKGRGCSITLYLASQRNPYYDPVFAATVEPTMQYARVIWHREISLGALERAWRATLDKVEGGDDKLTWAAARGPLKVVIPSFKRIGWVMCSSLMVKPEEGAVISLLATPPRFFFETS